MRRPITMRASRGFTLVELLIVVTIILVITAIAIPNFLRAKMSANEASAVACMRSVTKAQAMYITAHSDLGFSCKLPDLGPFGADFLDDVMGCSDTTCTKGGYKFTLSCDDPTTPVSTFLVTAFPTVPGNTGQRSFCVDESGLMRFDPKGGKCTNASVPLQ